MFAKDVLNTASGQAHAYEAVSQARVQTLELCLEPPAFSGKDENTQNNAKRESGTKVAHAQPLSVPIHQPDGFSFGIFQLAISSSTEKHHLHIFFVHLAYLFESKDGSRIASRTLCWFLQV